MLVIRCTAALAALALGVSGACSSGGGVEVSDAEVPQSTCDPVSWGGVFMAADPSMTTHAPIFRRHVEVDVPMSSAPVRVIGLGDYQLHVNGQRVTEALSNQPWSQFDRRIYWREYDLAPFLRRGVNEITVQLGASWWYVGNVPSGTWLKEDAVSRFDPEHPFALGVASDVLELGSPGWEWARSPLTFTHVLGGETYNASAEVDAWSPALPMCAPAVSYERYAGPLFVPHETEEPVRVLERGAGTYTYYFAQNTAAYVQFDIEGKAGQHVAFVPSEYVTTDGDVEQRNVFGKRVAFDYVLRGGGVESHEAQFFYHGFQFVRVDGAVPEGAPNPSGLPVLHHVRSVHVRLANTVVGSFTTSSALYNQIHELADWSFKSNSSYVLTDCPHREKLGWLEQTFLLQRSLAYRYDLARWYAKIARDIRDAQMPDGLVQNVAPHYLQGTPDNAANFTVEWGAAAVFVPWELYRAYGDLDELRQSYASMRAFVDSVAARSPSYIAPGGLGDWYDYVEGQMPGWSVWTPRDLSATAMFALATHALISSAEALGETDDFARYTDLVSHVQAAFWSTFFDPATGQLRHNGSPQTAHAMALEADVVPPQYRAQLLDAIVVDLQARGFQQTSGDIGHVYLIRALARAGRSDVLHRIYSRQDVGSYGGMIAKGLTTLSERWDGEPASGASLNHAMLGHVIEWFYGYVAGIRQSETSIGWSEIEIGPNPGALLSATGSVDVPRGTIAVQWSKSGNDLTIDVTIPPGPDARVSFPSGRIGRLSENGVSITPVSERMVPAGHTLFVVRYRP